MAPILITGWRDDAGKPLRLLAELLAHLRVNCSVAPHLFEAVNPRAEVPAFSLLLILIGPQAIVSEVAEARVVRDHIWVAKRFNRPILLVSDGLDESTAQGAATATLGLEAVTVVALDRTWGRLHGLLDTLQRLLSEQGERAAAPGTASAQEDALVGDGLRAMHEAAALRFELSTLADPSGISTARARLKQLSAYLTEIGWSEVSRASELQDPADAYTLRKDLVVRPPLPPRKKIVVDTVMCSVFAPPKVRRGDSVLVQVFAHLASEKSEVAKSATEHDEAASRRQEAVLNEPVPRGTELGICLNVPGAIVDDPVQSLVWRGEARPSNSVSPSPKKAPPET